MCLSKFILISMYFAIIVSSEFRSDYDYYPNIDSWLKLHLMPATWRNAFKICDYEGAVLASPTTPNMRQAMADHVVKKSKNQCTIFTGIHSTFSKGFFSSVEGIPLARLPLEWAAGEPDNLNNNEECIIFTKHGTIMDVDCADVHPFMCFKKNDKNLVMTSCGTIDKEYEWNPITQNCYKFHGEAKPWRDAYTTCEAEGAHLAIINSDKEAQFVKNLADRKNSTITVGSSKNIILLGIHDWGSNGIWRTIHGLKLSEAGYFDWQPSQPDNKLPGQHCGAMFRSNKKLDDFWCEASAPFVCEKTPERLVPSFYYR